MRKIWYAVFGVAALVLVLVAGLAAFMYFHTPYVVAFGTPIRHDDFLFTVTQLRRKTLTDGAAHYRVAIDVKNEAKRVDYQWRDSIAYVRAFDDRGFGHDIFALTHGSFILPAGQSRTATLEFRVPAGLSSANLRFWDGIFMGDAFNGGAYGKAIVPLEPYHPPFGT
jgi:hypothetical protein